MSSTPPTAATAPATSPGLAPSPTFALRSTQPGSSASSSSSTSNPTSAPNTTKAAQESALGKVLFHDDFANTSSGWVTSDLGSIQFAYEGGEYLIAPKKGDLNSHALLPNRQFDNISVQVDARFVSGSADSIFGLICRATAGTVLEKAYEFLITPDGGYGILKIAGPGAGESKLLGQEGKSNAIRRGNATNQLRADCSASNLALYVNGQKLLAAQDSDFKMGQVGFAISTPSKSNGFEARFDNFVVRDAAP